MTARTVNEAERDIVFVNGDKLSLNDVTEIDNSGTYLRITARQGYYLVNPEHVLYHRIPTEAKLF